MTKLAKPFQKYLRWAVRFPNIYPDAYMSLHATRAEARKMAAYENSRIKGIAIVVDRRNPPKR